MRKKVECRTFSRFERSYLSRTDVRSHRDRVRNRFPGREVSRPDLWTIRVYLAPIDMVAMLEDLANDENALWQ